MRNLRPSLVPAVIALSMALAVIPAGPAAAQQQPPATQNQEDHSQHHPGTGQTTPPSAQPAGPGQSTAPAPRTEHGSGMGMMGRGGSQGGQGGMMMHQGGAMMHSMPMMRSMTGEPAESGMARMAVDHVEGWLAFVRTELKITKDQTSQWNEFAKAARNGAKSMRAGHSAMMGMQTPATWPDRLDRTEQMLAARLNAVRSQKVAARTLYDVLSTEQKTVADALMRGPMGMM
ncbi:MAG: hypothetical protein FJX35_21780 [Alphaproteobacteria bacterium]|nr:hypothetical protein [Alphaproteobacteria bacterium]